MLIDHLTESVEDNAKTFSKNHPSIFHYTDFIALEGILDGKLWLRSPFTMKDLLECKGYINNIFKTLKQHIPDKATEIDKLINISNNLLKGQKWTIACFSTACDSMALWDYYANNSKGVCIEFNTNKLLQIFNYGIALSLHKVYYSAGKEFSQYVNLLIQYLLNNDLSEFKTIDSLIWDFVGTSVFHKNQSYEWEKEIRLLKNYQGGDFYTPDFSICKDNIQYIEKLNLKALCILKNVKYTDLFSSITIGPASNQKLESLQHFVEYKGLPELADKIKYSNCIIRN